MPRTEILVLQSDDDAEISRLDDYSKAHPVSYWPRTLSHTGLVLPHFMVTANSMVTADSHCFLLVLCCIIKLAPVLANVSTRRHRLTLYTTGSGIGPMVFSLLKTVLMTILRVILDLDLERSRQTPDVGYHVDERRRRTSADDS